MTDTYKYSKFVITTLFLSLMLPIFPIGNRFELCEPLIYVFFFSYFIINRQKITKFQFNIIKINIIFFVIQIISIVLGILYNRQDVTYGSDDLYELRLLTQISCSIALFESILRKNLYPYNKKFLHLVCIVLIIPSIITIIQYYDIFGAKNFITDIYETIYLLESRDFRLNYRVASVFSDSYTSGIYITWVTLFITHLLISKKINISVYTIVFIFNYFAMFCTLRTGLIAVPLGIILMIIFATFDKKNNIFKLFFYLITGTLLTGAIFLTIMLNSIETFTWALEVTKIFDLNDSYNEISSLYQTNTGNIDNLIFILNNLDYLFFPAQLDIGVENFQSGVEYGLLLDSFYFSGIFRYGIYILILYFYIIYQLIKIGINKKNYFLISLSIISIIISWKGSNGLLLTKSVIPLGFMISFSIFHQQNNKLRGSR